MADEMTGAELLAAVTADIQNYFTNETVEKYDNMPNLIKSIDKFKMIELAREFADSGIKGFAAVSSTEKAFINSLEARLNF